MFPISYNLQVILFLNIHLCSWEMGFDEFILSQRKIMKPDILIDTILAINNLHYAVP